MVVVAARSEVGLQHRSTGFLRLQEERVVLVAALQQDHQAACPDAADPHDLHPYVDHLVALEQRLAAVVEARLERLERGESSPLRLIRVVALGAVAQREQHRRLCADVPGAIHLLGELRQRVEAGLLGGTLLESVEALVEPRSGALVVVPQVVDPHMVVPELEVTHLCVLRHRLPVGPCHLAGGASCLLGGQPEVLRGDHHARRQTLEVPFPGARERLVEVVLVEHQSPLRGGVRPEVRQVGVTSELHLETGVGAMCQVRRHDVGGTTEERELGLPHPLVADRHQEAESASILFLQQRHRIRSVRSRLPAAVGRARQRPPRLAPDLAAFLGGQPCGHVAPGA